jgi:DNA adenine methylase
MCKGVAKPFLKWAGGKGQLLNKFEEMYPQELINGEIDTYIEPFVGGGAVLFDVLQKYKVKKAVIIDLNKELINCYRSIKADVSELIAHLKKLQDEFLLLADNERKEYFLKVRNRYNEIHLNGKYDFEKAADFIFLNKTCFNGLYRVNSKGEFNVPFGKYKNPLICDSENLTLINKLLQNIEIRYGDYSVCEEYVNGKTFVYFDPPYRPLIENTSFVGYDKSGFNDDNQKELAEFVKKLDKQNCLVMLSNSDPKNTNPNDNFFDELYKGFEIDRIFAKRMINCQADKRGDITEIVVRDYKRR